MALNFNPFESEKKETKKPKAKKKRTKKYEHFKAFESSPLKEEKTEDKVETNRGHN